MITELFAPGVIIITLITNPTPNLAECQNTMLSENKKK